MKKQEHNPFDQPRPDTTKPLPQVRYFEGLLLEVGQVIAYKRSTKIDLIGLPQLENRQFPYVGTIIEFAPETNRIAVESGEAKVRYYVYNGSDHTDIVRVVQK